jgi:hypothetical protein
MKILICGDSFAADWTVKYAGKGWPNLLADRYDVTNLAQAGCSEYRIYRQLQAVNLSRFDKIIISHTSPNRIYVTDHPIHRNDSLHGNSDLIYSDIKEHSKKTSVLDPIIHYFEQYFDLEYAEFVHNMLCERIDNLTKQHDVVHITSFSWDGLFLFPDMIQFENTFAEHSGSMNHYDEEGNAIIFNRLVKRLEENS